jgi:hypothetical protein
MTEKINIVGAKPKRVHIVNKARPRIDPAELAAALGATPCGERLSANADLIDLGELGTRLLARLRSSGGRPALADATEICRVPLSAENLKTLEGMVAQIEQSRGAKPSVGQLVSVIVQTYLETLSEVPDQAAKGDAPKAEAGPAGSVAILQKMLDEQLAPLREKVKRLESMLHAGGGSS